MGGTRTTGSVNAGSCIGTAGASNCARMMSPNTVEYGSASANSPSTPNQNRWRRVPSPPSPRDRVCLGAPANAGVNRLICVPVQTRRLTSLPGPAPKRLSIYSAAPQPSSDDSPTSIAQCQELKPDCLHTDRAPGDRGFVFLRTSTQISSRRCHCRPDGCGNRCPSTPASHSDQKDSNRGSSSQPPRTPPGQTCRRAGQPPSRDG